MTMGVMLDLLFGSSFTIRAEEAFLLSKERRPGTAPLRGFCRTSDCERLPLGFE